MTRSAAELDRIGREVVAARQVGVLWKVLEHHYGMSRMNLWRLWRRAQAPQGKNVTRYTAEIASRHRARVEA